MQVCRTHQQNPESNDEMDCSSHTPGWLQKHSGVQENAGLEAVTKEMRLWEDKEEYHDDITGQRLDAR